LWNGTCNKRIGGSGVIARSTEQTNTQETLMNPPQQVSPTRRLFHVALVFAFCGAVLAVIGAPRAGLTPPFLPIGVWYETARPLVLAASLLALSFAVAVTLGGAPDVNASSTRRRGEQINRNRSGSVMTALWTALGLCLLALLQGAA
jgi:hypothetical protein